MIRARPPSDEDIGGGYWTRLQLRNFDLAFKMAMVRALIDGLEQVVPGVYQEKPQEPSR